MIGVEVMGPVRRWWWDALLGRRRHLQFFVERWPRWAGRLVRARAFAHFLVGNVHATAAMTGLAAAVMFGASSWWLMAAAAVWWLVAEVVLKAVLYVRTSQPAVGVLLWLVGWREAWRLRRRLPAGWAEPAAKTRAVQAEVGTSKEPVASALLRPVVDHPKMSWWPTIRWPQVSWWVGPPPGRTFAQFDEVLDVLATNNPRTVSYELEYDRITDSFARLTVSFRSVLDQAVEPVETPVDAEPWVPVVIEGGQSNPVSPVDVVTLGDLGDDQGVEVS